MDKRGPEDMLHRDIGIYATRQTPYRYRFPSRLDIRVTYQGDKTRMEYHTPVGTISTPQIYTEDLRKAGSTIAFLAGHPAKKKEDYRVLAFLEAVRKHRPEVVGPSALLTTTMPEMKRVIEGLGRSGLREQVKVIIGGRRSMPSMPKRSELTAMPPTPLRPWKRPINY